MPAAARESVSRSSRLTFSIMPTRPCASMAARSSSAMLSTFVFFHSSFSDGGIDDELRVRLEHRVDDAQAIGAERRSGLRHLDDGVGQHRRLDLGRAPRELDVDRHVQPGEVGLSRTHEFRGDRLAREILRRLERRILGNSQHPLHPAEALLGVDEVRDRDDGAIVAGCRRRAPRPSRGRSAPRRSRHPRRSAPSPARGSAGIRCPGSSMPG